MWPAHQHHSQKFGIVNVGISAGFVYLDFILRWSRRPNSINKHCSKKAQHKKASTPGRGIAIRTPLFHDPWSKETAFNHSYAISSLLLQKGNGLSNNTKIIKESNKSWTPHPRSQRLSTCWSCGNSVRLSFCCICNMVAQLPVSTMVITFLMKIS